VDFTEPLLFILKTSPMAGATLIGCYLICRALWKKNEKLEAERQRRESDLRDVLRDDSERCRKDLADAIGRIRGLEQSRLNDAREDKHALLKVLETNSEAMNTSARAFEKLAEVEASRESSGTHRIQRQTIADASALERK
jgi:hypothetical protein